jgi:EAL domain-containing protein (putative c-di-GMP-specific phosphodiesterase class I)/GGDEF domain-containing protein
MLTWLVVAFVADLIGGLGPVKALFNASQYTISMGAATVALDLGGGQVPLTLVAEDLPEMLAAAFVFFVVNHVLAGAGVAFLNGVRVLPFLRTDLDFLSWTAGFQLALAPLLLGAPGALMALGPSPCWPSTSAAARRPRRPIRRHTTRSRGCPTGRCCSHGRRRPGSPPRRHGDVGGPGGSRPLQVDQRHLGHHAGDVVLQRVAERMSSAIRSKDLLARMGGDEFAVLLLDCDEPQARAFGARLVTALDEPVDVEDLALQISASVGLAQAAEGAAAEDVLQQADVALYRAKSDGVPVAVYAAGGQRPSAVDRLALGRALDVALRTDAIDVHFQVKVPTAGDLPPAMEALARWRDPEHGAVSPAQFIPVAEETGMIKRLTARVLDVALGRCAGLRETGIPMRMAVNVSPKSLVDDSLPALVHDALRRHGLSGEALQIEITESAAVANIARATPVIEALRALDVTLAIDDFGTGFSSLAQLQALPVEEIKIDRSFVLALVHDPQAEVIVRSIVTLGHSLGLKVTAEGVETTEAFERVAALGCDYTQGFLFGRPSAIPSSRGCARAPGSSRSRRRPGRPGGGLEKRPRSWPNVRPLTPAHKVGNEPPDT